MTTPEVILVSEFPLPYNKIGSWSTLYKNYLSKKNNIDFIVCNEPEYFFKDVNYQIVKNNFWTHIYKKITKKRHHFFIQSLSKLIKNDKKYIVQIIDNIGFLNSFEIYVKRKNNRHQFYIQYFYHGYVPELNQNESDIFYNSIDEIIVLTSKAKDEIRKKTNIQSLKISYLHNGVDNQKFFVPSENLKQQLKKELNLTNKKIFVWCSQDRPKKGLQIILDLWTKKYSTTTEYVLLVIGCDKKDEIINGVQFLGKINNDLLPKYYQVADVYLFPTICEEGFGMSLIEALLCGCYCIASNYGGVSEVLNHGQYGTLINNPHDIENWFNAIEDYTNRGAENNNIPENLYSSDKWNQEMDEIIIQAKNKFNE